MNKIVVITVCGLLAGCVSVEKTRERLASGDAEQIAEAKRDARRLALDRTLSEDERIEYVRLITDNDELFKMLPYVDSKKVQNAVVGQMSFSEEEFPAKFATAYGYHMNNELSRYVSDDAVSQAIHLMCVQADFDNLYAARKIFRVDSELEKEMGDALMEKASTDAQYIKVFGICRRDGYDGWQQQCVNALAKVSSQSMLLDLLCSRDGRRGDAFDVIVGFLTDDTIVQFIRDDARFLKVAEDKSSLRLCAKMKDKRKLCTLLVGLEGPRAELCSSALKNLPDECLVTVAEKAKSEKLRNYAAWDVRSLKTVERLICGGKISLEAQKTLVLRIEKGCATRKMYDAVKDEKVRKDLLEKMPRELRKEIEK